MPDIALVHDALPFWGGAERVLASLLDVFPNAPVFTLLYNQARFKGTVLENLKVQTSFIDRLPGVYRNHYLFTPLFPLAIEQFNLSKFQVVMSLNYAVAHGVKTTSNQLHIGYTFTPLRHLWQNYDRFLARFRGPEKAMVRFWLQYLRAWDARAATRVHHFVAISQWVAILIEQAYGRKAEVVYPPVDVDRFEPAARREDYYAVVSRMAPHKKIPVVVDAFSELGLPLIVVGEGEEYEQVQEKVKKRANIHLLGWQPEERVSEILGRAKAFIHLAEDDFGIAPVEAQAAGCPVIAFGRGGARETILNGITGVLFDDQSVEGVKQAVRRFEEYQTGFDVCAIRKNAERFSRARFENEMRILVEREWDKFVRMRKETE